MTAVADPCRTRLLWAATALVISIACGAIATAAPRQAPGSRVVLDLPADWRVAQRFTGFEHPRGGSIVVMDLPGAARGRLTRSLAPDALQSKGIVDVDPLDLGRADVHTALAGRQPTRHGWFRKYMLLIGDDETTALVSANLPQSALDDRSIDSAAVVAALGTAKLAWPGGGEAAPPSDARRRPERSRGLDTTGR